MAGPIYANRTYRVNPYTGRFDLTDSSKTGFLNLLDTPDDYTGFGGYYIAVNVTEYAVSATVAVVTSAIFISFIVLLPCKITGVSVTDGIGFNSNFCPCWNTK